MATSSPIQLGRIPIKSKVWILVPIQNVLDEDIVIFDVTTSCGCLATDFRPTRLSPGEQLIIEITLTSRQRVGAIREQVRLFSTSEALNDHVIVLEGDAVLGPQISEVMEFGTVRPEMGAECRTVIHDVPTQWVASVDQMKAIADRVSIPLKFEFSRLNEDEIEMRCLLEPCSLRGYFETTLRIYLPTAAAGVPGIFLETQLKGAGIPVIWAEPAELLGSNLLDESRIQLRWLDGHSLTLPKQSDTGPGYSWTISEVNEVERLAVLNLLVSSRGQLEESAGIRIPFSTPGNGFDLLLPYYPKR